MAPEAARALASTNLERLLRIDTALTQDVVAYAGGGSLDMGARAVAVPRKGRWSYYGNLSGRVVITY